MVGGDIISNYIQHLWLVERIWCQWYKSWGFWPGSSHLMLGAQAGTNISSVRRANTWHLLEKKFVCPPYLTSDGWAQLSCWRSRFYWSLPPLLVLKEKAGLPELSSVGVKESHTPVKIWGRNQTKILKILVHKLKNCGKILKGQDVGSGILGAPLPPLCR